MRRKLFNLATAISLAGVKRYRLDVLTGMSVLLLFVLFWGYLSAIGVFGFYFPSTGWHHDWELVAEEAVARVAWKSWSPSVERPPVPTEGWGIHLAYPQLDSLNAPSLRASLWGFDARRYNDGTRAFWYVNVPIWCVALPCLIAPALWARRWRKKRMRAAGFEVISG